MYVHFTYNDNTIITDCTWTWVDPSTELESCYILKNEHQTFENAELQCQKYGGHLATPTTEAEIKLIKDQLTEKAAIFSLIWTGVSLSESGWKYQSGAPVENFDWGPWAPQQACVRMRLSRDTKDYTWDYTWYNYDCTAKAYFLCETVHPIYYSGK